MSTSPQEAIAVLESLPDQVDSRALSKSITRKDQIRWAQFRYGTDPKVIAAREKVPLYKVLTSIQKYLAYFACNSHEVVDAKVNSVVLESLDDAQKLIKDAMEAKRLLGNTKEGEPIFEPDHELRLKIIDVLSRLIDKVRPKGNAQQVVNVNQWAGTVHVSGDAEGRAQAFAEIVRKVRGEEGIIDAEVVPVNEYNPEEDKNLIDESAEDEEGNEETPDEETEEEASK